MKFLRFVLAFVYTGAVPYLFFSLLFDWTGIVFFLVLALTILFWILALTGLWINWLTPPFQEITPLPKELIETFLSSSQYSRWAQFPFKIRFFDENQPFLLSFLYLGNSSQIWISKGLVYSSNESNLRSQIKHLTQKISVRDSFLKTFVLSVALFIWKLIPASAQSLLRALIEDSNKKTLTQLGLNHSKKVSPIAFTWTLVLITYLDLLLKICGEASFYKSAFSHPIERAAHSVD